MRDPKKRIHFIVLLILIASLFTAIIVRKSFKEAQQPLEDIKSKTIYAPVIKYGFNMDSFEIVNGFIERNQLFSTLLSPYQVSAALISEIADSAESVLPLKRIQEGKKFQILLSRDSFRQARFFIYEKNAIEFVVFKLFEPIRVYESYKKVDTIISMVSGVINRSLWADMAEAGSPPMLIHAMSEIYEWDIDFFRINKGDKYKIIFEETFVEGESVGIGKIKAAWFENNSDSFYAFYFVQRDRDDYFDDKGRNLRKMLLKAPLKFSRVSSGFSNSRYHPVLHRYRAHHGVDYAAPAGTPVNAVGDGKVIQASYSRGAGNMVKIRHNSVYTTAYLHLSRYAKGIHSGVHVKQGDVIGYVGSTGLSTGAHLDYRIWKNGSAINPLTLKLPPVESVVDSNMTRFLALKDKLMIELNSIEINTKE